MATPTILHVGDDICYRVQVMQRAGLKVVLSEPSVSALQDILFTGEPFAGIAFQSEISPPSRAVVSTARKLSPAPLVLFDNPSVACDERLFDLVIDGRTSPAIWLESLQKTIAKAQQLRDLSIFLRQDCESVGAVSRKLCATAEHARMNPIDPDAIWRNNSGESS